MAVAGGGGGTPTAGAPGKGYPEAAGGAGYTVEGGYMPGGSAASIVTGFWTPDGASPPTALPRLRQARPWPPEVQGLRPRT